MSDARTLKLEIDYGPKCPHCQMTGFDDWWHDKGIRAQLGLLTGSLKCHGCGKFFAVKHWQDGQTYSTAWSKQR
jgi:hypothetical protein